MARGLMAACLALVFAYTSLAPVSAETSSESAHGCCRGRGRCCCHGNAAKPPAAPVFSKRPCGDGCGEMALTGSGVAGFAALSHSSAIPPAAIFTGLSSSDSVPTVGFSDEAHRQRPPPAFLASI